MAISEARQKYIDSLLRSREMHEDRKKNVPNSTSIQKEIDLIDDKLKELVN